MADGDGDGRVLVLGMVPAPRATLALTRVRGACECGRRPTRGGDNLALPLSSSLQSPARRLSWVIG